MTAVALLRVQRHAARLEAAGKFYSEVLGFQLAEPAAGEAGLARLLGVARCRVLRMKLGEQVLELYETDSKSEPFPPNLAGNDLRFQHIAVVTTDMNAAYKRVMDAGVTPLSSGGPRQLPPGSGGVIAFKFYDPEGHPLELLQFPRQARGQSLFTGFDHSAITVSSVARSVAFYNDLGVRLSAQQLNHGPAQDALDALRDTIVDVLALKPDKPTPHLELLHYRQPAAAPVMWQKLDMRADRLVFASSEPGLRVARDPDGHEVLLEEI